MLSAGTRLGAYEIVCALGAGGMGEVYRARDTRLGREVALKFLPEGFAEDPERHARFEREAKVLASLNNPNIAVLYGLEHLDGRHALVMELVEGEGLDDRIARGPVPVDEALPIALQIAEALEAAHEKGIVHRDLKPANVKARPDGTVKVLDFGLAKAWEEEAAASDPAYSPTITGHHTRAGLILGTAAYMSPEQARGKTVDKRSDIWSFGVVLWEMLVGRSLFAANTVSDTLAAVLTREVDLARLPEPTPGAIRGLLRRCLERNPKNRLRDIGDARIVLGDVLAGRVAEPRPVAAFEGAARTSLATRLLWTAAALVMGGVVIAALDRTVLAPPVFEPPMIVPLTYSGFDVTPDASPDGKTIAFSSIRDGRWRVWLKQLATGAEVPLTAGVDVRPQFSPDGGSIAFTRVEPSVDDIYRVPIVGGGARRLARNGSKPIWSPDGKWIVFDRVDPSGGGDKLMIVPADGGQTRELKRIEGRSVLGLAWSPGGRSIAVLATDPRDTTGQELIAVNASSGDVRPIRRFPRGLSNGCLTWNGNRAVLLAMAVSRASQGPFPLLRVPVDGGTPHTVMSLNFLPQSIAHAGPGRLVVDAGDRVSNLRLLELSGGRLQGGRWLSRGESVDRQPDFSHDGRSIVFTSDRGGTLNIWGLSPDSSAVRRLTHDPAGGMDPQLTPDGKHLLWSSNRSGNFEIWIADSDGSDAHQLSHDGIDAENPTMTPDGRWIVYSSARPNERGLWKMRPDGSDAQRFLKGVFILPEVSPNGQWVACLDMTGSPRAEVTIRVVRIADGAEIARVGVHQARFVTGQVANGVTVGRTRWMPDGRTVVFLGALSEDRNALALFVQPIEPGRDTTAERRLLYRTEPESMAESFGISPDGKWIVVSLLAQRSDLALLEGLPGIGPQ
jgi:Tol biopolymer transport system component